jgi:hypothetical protein
MKKTEKDVYCIAKLMVNFNSRPHPRRGGVRVPCTFACVNAVVFKLVFAPFVSAFEPYEIELNDICQWTWTVYVK